MTSKIGSGLNPGSRRGSAFFGITGKADQVGVYWISSVEAS
jgi:hypothetical protein